VDRDQRKVAITASRQLPAVAGDQYSAFVDYKGCILRYVSHANVAHGPSLVQKMFRDRTEARLDRYGPVTEPVPTRSLTESVSVMSQLQKNTSRPLLRRLHDSENNTRTIAIEEYESKDHEEWMIVEFLVNVVVPCKATAEVTHPHADHYHHRQSQHLR